MTQEIYIYIVGQKYMYIDNENTWCLKNRSQIFVMNIGSGNGR